jgi:hypothetical protein
MPDKKMIVKSAAKIALLFIGMCMLFMFIANYQGRLTYSPDFPFLIGIFIIGCTFIFFGVRQKRDKDSDEVVLATGLQRFTHLFVDVVICRTINITIITFYPNFFIKLIRSYGEFAVSFILGLAVLLCYYFLFETILQRTPSKFITKTKVVTENLTRPNILSTLMRSLIRIVPFEPFSIFTEKGLWHDNWSKTYVISE